MNYRIILAYFGIFGCWARFIPGTVGQILFGIWFGLVLFWIFVNGAGVILYFTDKLKLSKEAKKAISPLMIRKWWILNFLAIFNYIAADLNLIALAFLLTSCFFMWITGKEIEK